jgi:hypothetical protein
MITGLEFFGMFFDIFVLFFSSSIPLWAFFHSELEDRDEED